jgi:hypothetical protein
VAKGISGIAYGSRPAPVTDIDLAELTAVATSWIGEYFSRFEKQIADRGGHLVGSGPVLAAVGAMGQELLTLGAEDRAARQRRAPWASSVLQCQDAGGAVAGRTHER